MAIKTFICILIHSRLTEKFDRLIFIGTVCEPPNAMYLDNSPDEYRLVLNLENNRIYPTFTVITVYFYYDVNHKILLVLNS